MSNMNEHDDFVESEDIWHVNLFVEHKIEVGPSSLELVDATSFSFTKFAPTPLLLGHSTP